MSDSSVPGYLITSLTETKVDNEYNIAIGVNALVNNSNVSYNMNDGSYSLLPNLTGVNNTAVGDSSLRDTKGKNNTALGYKSGISNIVGNNNTFLGNSADCNSNNLNNSTAIGYKSKITKDNQIVLGNSEIIEVNIPSEKASIKLGSTLLTQDKINSFATTSEVDKKISDLVGEARETLDTLAEIGNALNNDENLASNLINRITCETSRATSVEGVLNTGLSSEVFRASSVENKLSSEVSRVETTLSSSLSSEVSRVETTLSSSLSSEVSRAGSVESQLSTELNLKAPLASPTFTGSVNTNCSILPTNTSQFNIGSANLRFKSIYVDDVFCSANTLHIGEVSMSQDEITGGIALPSGSTIDGVNITGSIASLQSSLTSKANFNDSAQYLYKSEDFNLNLMSSPKSNIILSVVNTGNGSITITYESNTLTLSTYTYASFIYSGTTWHIVTS
jgi:hypothetical protein